MQVGDIVFLKSGSTAMTVVMIDHPDVHPYPQARCVWQGGEQWFPLVALTTEQPMAPRATVQTERDYGDWPPKLTDKLPGDLA
jgi:hypothetical protein